MRQFKIMGKTIIIILGSRSFLTRTYATNQFIKCTCLVKRQETALSSVVKRSFNFSLCSGKP